MLAGMAAAAMLAAWLPASPVLAGELQTESSLSTSFTVSNSGGRFGGGGNNDPLTGGNRNQNDETSYVSTIAPALTANYVSGHVNAALVANLPIDVRLNDGDVRLRQSVRGTSTLDLWNERFLIDIEADSRRDLVSNQSRANLDPIADDNNRSTVNNIEINPSFSSRLGGLANLRLSYSERWSLSETASDTINRRGNVILSTPNPAAKIGWTIFYNHRVLERRTGGTTVSSNNLLGGSELNSDSVRGSLSYRLNTKLRLLSSLGYESIRRSAGLNDTTDPTWSVGFDYTPFQDLRVNITYGQQFGRTSIGGNLALTLGKRWVITGAVSDSLDTLEREISPFLTAFDPGTGQFIDLVSGLPLDLTRDDFGVRDEISRARNWQFAVTADYGNTSLRMTLTALDRDFDFRGDNLTVLSAFNIARQLPGNATLTLGLQHRYNRERSRIGVSFPLQTRQIRSYAARIGYQKTLSERLFLDFGYTYSDGDFGVEGTTLVGDDKARSAFTGGLSLRL